MSKLNPKKATSNYFSDGFGQPAGESARSEWEQIQANRRKKQQLRFLELENATRDLVDNNVEDNKPTIIPQRTSANEYPWDAELDVWNGSFDPKQGIFETAQTQYSKRKSILSRPLMARTPEEQRYLDNTSPISRKSKQDIDTDDNKEESTSWWKDVFSNVVIDKNKTEIKTAVGEVTRAREKQNYLTGVETFLNYLTELSTLQAQIQAETSRINKNELVSRYNIIKGLADDLVPLLKEASTYDFSTPQNRDYSFITANYYGGTLPSSTSRENETSLKIKQLISDYSKNYDLLLSNSEQRAQSMRTSIDLYNNYVQNTLIPAQKQSIDEDLEDLRRIRKWHTPSAAFEAKAEAASDMKFLDADTYLYGMWGTIGSSAANNGFQLLAQGLKMIGAITTVFAPEVGIPVTAVGGAVGIASGENENNAEVAENYSSSLLNKLGNAGKLDDFVIGAQKQLGKKVDYEEAFRAFVMGDYVPNDLKIRRIAQDAAWGANNLFNNDMMATTYGELVETAIASFVPNVGALGKNIIGKGTKFAVGRKLVDFAAEHPSSRRVIDYALRVANAEEGYAVGATLNPVVGAATAAAAPAVSGATKTVFRPLVKKFGDKLLYAGKSALEQPGKLLAKKDAVRASLGFIKRMAGVSIAEGMEEGKQYVHGLKFQEGGFKGDAEGFVDATLNDIAAGSRAAYSFIGSQFFGMLSDRELMANIRGGMILPFTNHSTVTSAISQFGQLNKEIKSDVLVANNVMAMKLMDRLDIQNAVSYSKAARTGKTGTMNEAFNKMKALQKKLVEAALDNGSDEIPAYTTEEVELQRKLFERISSLSNSPTMKRMARNRGIDTNSDNYDTFIALYDYFSQRTKEAADGINEQSNHISQIISDAGILEDDLLKLQTADANQINDIIRNSSVDFTGIRVSPKKDDENDDEYQDRYTEEYRSAVIDRINKYREQVNKVAELDALFQLRDNLRGFDNPSREIKKHLSFVNNLITEAKKQLDDRYELITESELLDDEILDTDRHLLLKDLYRQQKQFAFDHYRAVETMFTLAGADGTLMSVMSNGQANRLLSSIYDKVYNSRKDVKGTLKEPSILKEDTQDLINDYLKSVVDDEKYEGEVYDYLNALQEAADRQEEESMLSEEQKEAVKRQEQQLVIDDIPIDATPNTDDYQQFLADQYDAEDHRNNKKLYNAPASTEEQDREFTYTEDRDQEEIVSTDRDRHKQLSRSMKSLLSNLKKGRQNGFTKSVVNALRNNVTAIDNLIGKGATLTKGERKALDSAKDKIGQIDNSQLSIDFDQQPSLNLEKIEQIHNKRSNLLDQLKSLMNGRLNAGIDPRIFTIGVLLIGTYLEEGYYKFSEIAPRIIDQLGNSIKDHIKSWYIAVKTNPTTEHADLMDSIQDVLNFDVDSLSYIDTSRFDQLFKDLHNLLVDVKKLMDVNKADDTHRMRFIDLKKQSITLFNDVTSFKNAEVSTKKQSDVDQLMSRLNEINSKLTELRTEVFELQSRTVHSIFGEDGSVQRRYIPQAPLATGAVNSYDRINNSVFEKTDPSEQKVAYIKKDGKIIVRDVGCKHFIRLMANRDFLTNAKFVVNSELYQQDRKFAASEKQAVYIDIYYDENVNGSVRTWELHKIPLVISKDSDLIKKLDSLLFDKEVKNGIRTPINKDKTIVLTQASRTNGVAVNNEGFRFGTQQGQLNPSFRPFAEAFNVELSDIRGLLEGSELGQIGITFGGNINKVRHNPNETPETIKGFREENSRRSGILTYVMNMRFNEDGENYSNHQIPIPLTPKNLTESDVNLIIWCLLNYGKKPKFKVGGRQYDSPLDSKNILRLLIRFGAGAEIIGNDFVFNFKTLSRTDAGVLYDFNTVVISDYQTVANGDKIRVIREVDLKNEGHVKWLKERLLGKSESGVANASVYYNDEFILWSNTSNKESTFNNLAQFFKAFDGQNGRAKIDSFKLSDSIQFDRSDVDPDGDGSYKGITGLEWKVKHGHIVTDFNHVELPLISFENAQIFGEEAQEEQQMSAETEQPTLIYIPDTPVEEIIDEDDPYAAFKLQDAASNKPLDEDVALRNIRSILGKKFPVKFVNQMVGLSKGGPIPVGYMHAACGIVLSRQAEQGTEFHEAFHEIFEFLIGDKRRNAIYTHYKNKYGKGRSLTYTQVSEELADMFMEFRNNTQEVHFSWNLLDTFNEIMSWVRAFARLNDRKLAWLFFQTSTGMLKSLNPKDRHTEQRINQFIARHNGQDVLYRLINIDGKKRLSFNYIQNKRLFDDCLDSLVLHIIVRSGIDNLGLNINKLKIDKEYIQTRAFANAQERKAIEKADKNKVAYTEHSKFYKNLVGEGLTDEELNQKPPLIKNNILMMREIFDNYENGIEELLFSRILALGTNGRKVREQLNKEDNDGGETGQSRASEDITGHSDGFYEFSREEDVSSAIKFLLSTIPALRYATQEDVLNGTLDKNGKPITSVVIRDEQGNIIGRPEVPLRKNSLGFITFLPFKNVYQPLLKMFYNVKDVADLDLKLTLAGQSDYVINRVARAFHAFRYKSWVRYSEKQYAGIPKVYFRGQLLDPTVYINNISNVSELEKYMIHPTATRDLEINGEVICKKGERIPGAYIVTNPDYESYCTQLYQSIKSQQLNFTFCFEKTLLDENGLLMENAHIYDVAATNSEQSLKYYPHNWFDNLLSMYNDVFTGRVKNYKITTFKDVSKFLRDLKTQVISPNLMRQIKFDGVEPVDYTTAEGYDYIVSEFVRALNEIGISISRSMLDYTLIQAFPEAENVQQAFIQMLSLRNVYSIEPLIKDGGLLDLLLNAVDNKNFKLFLQNVPPSKDKNGGESGSFLYANNGFIKFLSLWNGRYKLASQEMQLIGPENTRLYKFALNHTASDITYDLNQAEVDEDGNIFGSEVLKDMSVVDYVNTTDMHDNQAASVIYKQLMMPNSNPKHDKLQLDTMSGLKSDKQRDGGTKYVKMNAREVWIQRATILSQGHIVFPTLADKSTWFSLRGVNLPGLNYQSIKQEQLARIDPTSGKIWLNPDGALYQNNDILDQFIEYAWCDYKSALRVQDLMDRGEIPEAEQVKNFHKGTQNGMRLGFLIGVWKDVLDKNGKIVGEKYVSFNNNKHSIAKNLETAYTEFFELKEGETYEQYKSRQRSMIANNLRHRLEEELEYLAEQGVIEKVPLNTKFIISGKNQRLEYIKTSMNLAPFFGYRNKFLDYNKIQLLKGLYGNMTTSKGVKYSDRYTSEQLESLAISMYVFDVNARAIMSQLETQRFYTGMPHFFKWKYNDEGDLVDLRSDESKRYGGEGSTGVNNRTDLPNIETEYTATELKDQEISSPVYQMLVDLFTDDEYREALVSKYISEGMSNAVAHDKVYDRLNLPTSQVRELLDENVKSIIDRKIKAEADSYESGINVADGAAYITDKMAENLLRQRGVYTKDVQEAFEYLRGDRKVTYKDKEGKTRKTSYLTDMRAYRVIMDAMISTQKYSAFGYRMQHGIPVHYYNKFALFPIFKGISYGFSYELYKKMNDSEYGVDMVMFESAVKAGSQGAQSFTRDKFRMDDDPENKANYDENGNLKPSIKDFSFKGHIYKLKYSFIRRQLNTDPIEDPTMAIGTQALKVALSVLRKGHLYDGIDGETILNDIMDANKKLSKIGVLKMRDKFLNEDGTLNLDKFSDVIRDELLRRNADLNILDAIEIVRDVDENGNEIEGSEHFRSTLNAVSNMNWIESIIISMINKEVIDVNLPGNAFYQRSAYAIEGMPLTAISDGEDVSNLMLNEGDDLLMINEEGSMDCILSYDFFMNMQYEDEKGKKISLIPENIKYNFKKGRQWLIDNGIISGRKSDGSWGDATSNIMSYRIPTLAPSSVHALRCVDVIDSVRDTVILPKEFTKITGSDFDIDKLYMSCLNYIRIGDKATSDLDAAVDTYNKQVKEEYRLQNKILKNYLTILKSSGKMVNEGRLEYGDYIHMLRRSIDNDTSLLNGKEDGVLKVIDEAYGTNQSNAAETPFAYGSLSTQVDIMNQFITGKFGIGPFALNNNSHILTQLYDVSFDMGNNIMYYLNALSLHKYQDLDFNSILSWISALINAHVDVAKNAYITRLNVNQYTYNLTNLLVRAGFGKSAFWFLNQPIVRQLAQVYRNATGTIVEGDYVPEWERAEEAELDYISNFNFDKTLNDLIEATINEKDKNTLDAMSLRNREIYRNLFGINVYSISDGNLLNGIYYVVDEHGNPKEKKGSIMYDILTNRIIRKDPDKPLSLDNLKSDSYYCIVSGKNSIPIKLSPLEIQGYVFLAKREFDVYSRALSNLVSVTKIDTKKHGITRQEQEVYLGKYLKLKTDGKYFEQYNLRRMLTESFIDSKTNDAISLLKTILGTEMIQHSSRFADILRNICDIMNNESKEFKKAVTNGIMTYIKLKCITLYMQANNISWYDMIHSNQHVISITRDENTKKDVVLTVNNTTLASRMVTLISKMMQDKTGVYSNFVVNGIMTNNLLADLQKVPYIEPYGYEHYDLITLSNNNDDAQEIKNGYIDDWRQLYESDDDEIHLFAIDLAIYAFMTSGDNRGFTKFFQYVPLEIREELGYTDMMAAFRDAFVLGQPAEKYGNNYCSFFDIDVEEILRNLWLDNNVIPVSKLYRWQFDRTDGRNYKVPTVIGTHLKYTDIDKEGKELYRDNIYQMFAGVVMSGNKMRLTIKPNKNGQFKPFIKVRRDGSTLDSADPYILYELVAVGRKDYTDDKGSVTTIEYPIYGITYPKGFTIRSGGLYYQLYEYGRNDHYKHLINEDSYLKPDWEDIKFHNLDRITKLIKWFNISEVTENWKPLDKMESLFEDEPIDRTIINKFIVDTYNNTKTSEPYSDYTDLEVENTNNERTNTVLQYVGMWNRDQVEADSRTLYIFTDNTDRTSGSGAISSSSRYASKYGNGKYYPTSTTAVIRGLDNAMPISTMKYFYKIHQGMKISDARWTDADIDLFAETIRQEFNDILNEWNTGKYDKIMIPEGDGFFNAKISQITERRTPLLYDELNTQWNEFLSKINNSISQSNGTSLLSEVPTNVPTAQLNNAENNKNDSERFAGVQESELTISSEKTILSNEELKYWNEHGVDNMPRILVASERTDPVFHVNEILDILNGVKSVSQWGVVNGRRQVVGLFSGKEFAGLYLITKHDGIPMKKLLETKIPKLIHFSITGLGGTKYEPGVMKPDDLLDRIKEYISMGLDPDSVTIRIDPIVPGITTPRMIENIIKRASEMGIKRIRFSIMDAYQNTVTALEKVGYDFNTNYGINPKTGRYNFNAKQEKFDKIVDFMLLMSDKYGVSLGSCAENIVRRGISKEGCLSVSAVNKMLGTSIEDKGVDNNQQRDLCSCYGGKIDALAYGKNCASHCIYCYAKHENDIAMQYYNEDGTLKDNDFTRTSPIQQSTLNNTEQFTGVQDKEFYTKTAAYDYINDLVDIEGISRDNIELQHVPKTDDTDDYWVVRIKGNNQQPNQPTQRTPISTPSTPIQIYSDGSDIKGTGAIGYGAVFMHNGKAYGLSGTEASDEVSKLKQLFPDAKFSNPTMEMLALTTTLEHFANLGIGEHIEINQDYKGAVNFGDLWKYSEGSAQREAKAWKPKEAYIAHLVDRASAAINTIINNGGSVKIRWVKGHLTSGTEQARMNDLADSYAKSRDIYNSMSDVYGTTQQNDNSNDYNSDEYGDGEEMNHCK